ncbi:MAG: glycosyltransferase [Candidatus Sumerlaea chitinivorans]|nr:glycosyltransferase [Candidatus Sumerlaea chitinivorans]
MQEPLISILLPARNAEATIGDALESILAQTWVNWELVLVDDGSVDSTPEIAHRYARQDPRIKVHRAGGDGITSALRIAAMHARGEYLARMDADDIALPDRLERQIAALQENPRAAVCGGRVEDFGEVGEGRRRYSAWLNSLDSPEEIARNLFVECPLAHPTFLMRGSAFRAVGGYESRPWPEDYDLLLRFWLNGYELTTTPPPPILRWRDSPHRLSRRDPHYAPEAFLACKMHYLLQAPMLLRKRLVQWGAGLVGKQWLRAWPPERKPELLVDIDPRKIGQRIHGIAVVEPETLGAPKGRFCVIAVGVGEARPQIREWLDSHGWAELADYVFVA